jgi:hypothetical protein
MRPRVTHYQLSPFVSALNCRDRSTTKRQGNVILALVQLSRTVIPLLKIQTSHRCPFYLHQLSLPAITFEPIWMSRISLRVGRRPLRAARAPALHCAHPVPLARLAFLLPALTVLVALLMIVVFGPRAKEHMYFPVEGAWRERIP